MTPTKILYQNLKIVKTPRKIVKTMKMYDSPVLVLVTIRIGLTLNLEIMALSLFDFSLMAQVDLQILITVTKLSTIFTYSSPTKLFRKLLMK